MAALLAGGAAGMTLRGCHHGERQALKAGASPVTAEQKELPARQAGRIRAEGRAWLNAAALCVQNSDLGKLEPAQIDRVEALSSAELGQWLEEGRTNGAETALMQLLMERWCEIDQAAFTAWIEMLGKQAPQEGFDGSFSYMEMYSPWCSAAVAVLQRVDPSAPIPLWPGKIEFMPIGTVVQLSPVLPLAPPPPPRPDLATMSPEDALRWVVKNNGEYQTRELQEVAERMAETNPDAAMAWAEGMPRHLKERADAIKSILLKHNKDGDWVLAHAHLVSRSEDLYYVLTNTPALYGNPQGRMKVMEWLLQCGDKDQRAAALKMVIDREDSGRVGDAVSLLEKLTDRTERSRLLDSMLERYGGTKGWETLTDAVKSEPGNGAESMGAAGAARHLAETSVSGALRWADGLPADGRRVAAYAGAYSVWMRQDPEAATAAALALPVSPERTEALVTVGGIRGERFPEETLAWSQTLGLAERARILTKLTDGLMLHHGDQARAEAVQLLAAGTGGNEFREAVLRMMPDVSTPGGVKAAMAWVQQMPPGDSRRELISKLRNDSGSSTPEVKAWIETLPPGDRGSQ